MQTYHAVGIDQEAFRNAGEAPIDGGMPVGIGRHGFIRVSLLGEECGDGLRLILAGNADNRNVLRMRELQQRVILGAARRAPAGEE